MSIATVTRPAATPEVADKTPELRARFQALAARLRASLPAAPGLGHAIGITSCSRHEGVSTVATNLAGCAMDIYGGPVLLIDGNPQQPSLARSLGTSESPGLSDFLAGDVELDSCLRAIGTGQLKLLPVGTRRQRAATGRSDRASQMMEQVRRDFRLIVVDLPPCGAVDQGLWKSPGLDGVLLVIQSEHVRRQVAQRVKDDLARAQTRLLGVVLNKRKLHIPEWLYRKL